MITTTIKLQSRPEKRKEIAQTIKELSYQLSKSMKCRDVITYQDTNNKNNFILVGEWFSEHDLDEYLSSRLFSVLLGVHPLLVNPLEIELSSELESAHLRKKYRSLENGGIVNDQLKIKINQFREPLQFSDVQGLDLGLLVASGSTY